MPNELPGDRREANFHFWQKWLTWANIVTLCVGLLVAFAGNSVAFELHNQYSNELFFNNTQSFLNIIEYKNWLWGIIGGTIVGFHALMIFISEFPFKRKERWSYIALWTGLVSWFVIDSSVSAYYGAIYNILIINLFAFILIGAPLIATKNWFFK